MPREQGTEECSFFCEKMNTPPSPVHAFAPKVSERQIHGADSPDERLSVLKVREGSESVSGKGEDARAAAAQHRAISPFGKTAKLIKL